MPEINAIQQQQPMEIPMESSVITEQPVCFTDATPPPSLWAGSH